MPRAARSRIQVEIEAKPGLWSLFKGGFKSMKEAQDWAGDNISEGIRMRAIRVSGVFTKKIKVVKR